MSQLCTELPGKDGKVLCSGQSKIALQGARIRPKETLNNTVFTVFQDIPCMPPGASIPSKNCQERVNNGVIQLFSTQLFLWFAAIGAERLDSAQCTHCSWERGKAVLSALPVINQTRRESRLPARVVREYLNKASIIHCFPQ